MADLLSIPNLLSLLEVDRRNDVIKLCVEAESLRRRRRYAEAIQIAERAIRLARNDFKLTGTALLYASYARFSSQLPGQDRQAARDCGRAIRLLDLEPYNYAVATIIHAQLEAQMVDAQAALHYYLQAATTLKGVIRAARENNRMAEANRYLELQNKVYARIEQISGALLQAEPLALPAKLAAAAEKKPSQVPLPIPTSLVWPASAPVQIEFSPAGSLAFDLDVTRLIINNLHYNVQPVFPTPGGRSTLRLNQRQRYLALQVARKEDGFVLVRQQDRLDQDRQFVAVVNRTQQRAWVDEAKSAAPYTQVRIIGGDREWTISDEPEAQTSQSDELVILGIIEAILTPVEAA